MTCVELALPGARSNPCAAELTPEKARFYREGGEIAAARLSTRGVRLSLSEGTVGRRSRSSKKRDPLVALPRAKAGGSGRVEGGAGGYGWRLVAVVSDPERR